jgi:SHS2 domain-containing protein
VVSPGQSQPQQAGWKHFSHIADIGVEGYGPTLASAFEQAALALTAIITEPRDIRAAESVDIHCEAPDVELLLADWLNAIVFEMGTRRMIFGSFRVAIADRSLDAKAVGEPIEVRRHRPVTEVKGATLTELKVYQAQDNLWHARCVVDV